MNKRQRKKQQKKLSESPNSEFIMKKYDEWVKKRFPVFKQGRKVFSQSNVNLEISKVK